MRDLNFRSISKLLLVCVCAGTIRGEGFVMTRATLPSRAIRGGGRVPKPHRRGEGFNYRSAPLLRSPCGDHLQLHRQGDWGGGRDGGIRPDHPPPSCPTPAVGPPAPWSRGCTPSLQASSTPTSRCPFTSQCAQQGGGSRPFQSPPCPSDSPCATRGGGVCSVLSHVTKGYVTHTLRYTLHTGRV